MLLHRRHWHFALERDPERETRLLAFAQNAPDPQNPPPPTNTEAIASAGHDANGNPLYPQESHGAETEKNVQLMQGDELLRELVTQGRVRTQAALEEIEKKKVVEQKQEEEMKEKEEQQEEQKKMEEKFTEKEAIRNKFTSLIMQSQDIATKLKAMKTNMEKPELLESIKTYAPAEVQKHWEKRIQLLEREAFNTTQETQFITAMMEFWEAEKSPESFIAEQGEYLKNLPYGFAQVGEILHDLISGKSREEAEIVTGCTEEAWCQANKDSRIETIDAILKNVQMDDWIQNTKIQYEKMKKVLAAEEKRLEEDSQMIDVMRSMEEMEGVENFLEKFKGIRWYSIDNYLKGLQKYWTALKGTWEQRSERYSADIARKFGQLTKAYDLFPIYGQEVSRILDQQLDAKSNEETESMKNKLEKDNANWEMLFGADGEFYQFANKNPNKTRGVMEYAADHGFLYDIDEFVGNSNYPVYGKNLTDICSDWQDDPRRISNYFTLLRTKNAYGRDKEIESGKKKEHDIENVPRFIQLLEAELDDHNLWTAAGICERAMERGLMGEISAWLFTTIMNKLREYPELRAVTPQLFFDIVGKNAMYNTAFTLGWAKGYRRELRLWAKTGDENILKQTELKHLDVIEKDIVAKNPDLDITTKEGRAELNHLTAKVLAGHIVELPGGYIHIFETRFLSYREQVKVTIADVSNPLKEDSDYANEDTEKAMLTWETFAKILHFDSTRIFDNPTWASSFMGSLISMAERLGQIPELCEAYDNYCTEVREKMDRYFGASIVPEEATGKLASNVDPKTQKPAIASLVASHLLSWNIMEKWKNAPMLREQLKEFFPDFDVVAKDKDGKPAVKKPEKPSPGGKPPAAGTAPKAG